jgi:hypothetical protein
MGAIIASKANRSLFQARAKGEEVDEETEEERENEIVKIGPSSIR